MRKITQKVLLVSSVIIFVFMVSVTATTNVDQNVFAIFSPTGGCVPGGTTCTPCDPGLARIGANCIPSGDWHPSGLRSGGNITTIPPSVHSPIQGGIIQKSPHSSKDLAS